MKKVLLIGATGLLGKAILEQYRGNAEVIEASLNHSENPVDLTKNDSLKSLFEKVGKVDAVICTAGIAYFKPFNDATDEDWQFAINNKMMGQINIVRIGSDYVNDGGVIVLTTGTLAQDPLPGSSMVSAVNAAVESAVRAFSLELENIRINAVSPGWIQETLVAMGMEPDSGMAVSDVAGIYIDAVESSLSGDIILATQ